MKTDFCLHPGCERPTQSGRDFCWAHYKRRQRGKKGAELVAPLQLRVAPQERLQEAAIRALDAEGESEAAQEKATRELDLAITAAAKAGVTLSDLRLSPLERARLVAKRWADADPMDDDDYRIRAAELDAAIGELSARKVARYFTRAKAKREGPSDQERAKALLEEMKAMRARALAASVRRGMAKAKSEGKHVGRPPRGVAAAWSVAKNMALELGERKAAKLLSVPRTTLQRFLRRGPEGHPFGPGAS